MLAKINGLFRLTKEAELRYSGQGSAILKMSLACSEKFGEKESQLFIDATAFGKPAEILNQYASAKGTQIFLSGKLQTESWEKDGQRQYKTSMIIEGFDFVSKQSDNGENKRSDYSHSDPSYSNHAPREMPSNNGLPDIEIDQEDFPF